MTNILSFQLQELRLLKNFSSLKAIISGLQSNPVYRLKRAWSYVIREKLEIFEELARIFSGENNALAQRELLVREGTARFADTVGENDHHMQKILQKHSENSRVRTNLLEIYFFVLFFALRRGAGNCLNSVMQNYGDTDLHKRINCNPKDNAKMKSTFSS